MPHPQVKRALISVYDKTGIVEFAQMLVEKHGVEIISTGGTARLLKSKKIPVTPVEQVTGFPELMDGRVKTLHPKIHAAILADRDNPEHMRQLVREGIQPIDLVVVNLYPFEETVADPDCTFEQAIEMIDIGGPCLLRAAAKNHRHVLVVSDLESQMLCLAHLAGESPLPEPVLRCAMAGAALSQTAEYDGAICEYLARAGLAGSGEEGDEDQVNIPFLEEDGQNLYLMLEDSHLLRYGENPHQRAAFMHEPSYQGVAVRPEGVVAGDELSFNNFADADAALNLCLELSGAPGLGGADEVATPVCVFVKHTNACGVGMGVDPLDAYQRAYLGDPNAAMGGVLACNFPITPDFATAVMETYDRWGKAAGAGGFFVEVWIAPSFKSKAVSAIKKAKPWGKRVRLVEVDELRIDPAGEALGLRQIRGAALVQTPDLVGLDEEQWKVVTRRQPDPREMADLRLAWLVCKHTKSNAITICREDRLLGSGAGQSSRVMSCRIATWLARDNGHAELLKGAAAASDAFFPFRDGPDILADAGVTALIQPGGSKRDKDTIAACDERNLAMVFTGTRHFKH